MKKNRIVLALCGVIVGAIALPIVGNGLFPGENSASATVRADGENIEINETSFPDDAFRNYVRTFDGNFDGLLDTQELGYITELLFLGGGCYVNGEYYDFKGITDLTGIEYFYNLLKLECSSLSISELDLSKNTKLKELWCASCNLTQININGCDELEVLRCSDNDLSSIDVSTNTKLKEISCSNKKFSELHLSHCESLTNLDCANNQLDDIDVSNLSLLDRLNCSKNKLTTLDVRNNTELHFLFCSENQLSELDVSKNTSLECLECINNELQNLDVRNNTNLNTLLCDDNQLSQINLSANSELGRLSCSSNKIAQLDLSRNEGMGSLTCSDNLLNNLDLSNNVKLVYLNCAGNKLQSLDLTKHLELCCLNCSNNDINSISIGAPAILQQLLMHHNKISSFDLKDFEKILLVMKDQYIEKQDKGDYYLYIDTEKDDQYFSYDKSTTFLTNGKDPTKTPTKTVTKAPTKSVTKTPTNTVTKVPTKSVTKTPTKSVTKAPTKAPTVVPANGTIGDFVERLYTVALNRASEKEGKDYWIGEITSGRRTGGDCAHYFLIDAPEFLNRKLSVEAFVETLYQTFFGRASESAGKAYWVSEIKDGRKTRADVINGFIDSTEWCNICARYGVRSGAPSAKAEVPSQNAKDFATRLYTCCLGRDPEEDGLKYWSLALTNLQKTGAEAAKQFFESEEFQNLRTSNTEFATRLYRTFMGREPETDGLNYWVGELVKGRSRLYVMAGFASSQEFTNICKKYGIERGEIIVSEKDKNVPTITPTPATKIAIDANHFPDESFRGYIKEYLDKDHDGYLSQYEISQVKSIRFEHSCGDEEDDENHYNDFQSLEGIEYFTELEELYIANSTCEFIDISKCMKLKKVTFFEGFNIYNAIIRVGQKIVVDSMTSFLHAQEKFEPYYVVVENKDVVSSECLEKDTVRTTITGKKIGVAQLEGTGYNYTRIQIRVVSETEALKKKDKNNTSAALGTGNISNGGLATCNSHYDFYVGYTYEK